MRDTESILSGGKMKVSIMYRITLYLLFLVTIFSGCKREKALVARVATIPITIGNFEDEFAKGKTAEDIKKATLEDKRKYLDQMIDHRLKVINAYQLGLDTTKAIKDQLKTRSQGEMFKRLVELQVIQKIVPESELITYYENSKREVKIKQIVTKFDTKDPQSKRSALERIKRIERRLKNREEFEKLARESSEDQETAQKGGDKGYLKWGVNSSNNPIYAAAFRMNENEISPIIEAEDGYYIIKVMDIKTYNSPSYLQQKERIQRMFYSMKNKEIEDAYYAYLDKLRAKYRLQFNDQAIEFLVQNYYGANQDSSSVSTSQTSDRRKKQLSIDSVAVEHSKLVLANFVTGEITIQDLADEIKNIHRARRPYFKNAEEVKNYLNARLVPVVLLEKEAKRLRLIRDTEVQRQVRLFKENLMLRDAQKIQVENKINVTEEALIQYYNTHRSDYMHPEKREIQQIFVKDQKLADTITKLARKGADFDRLFGKYNEKESLEETRGKSEITAGRAVFGKACFAIEVGQVTDPIKLGDGYFVNKVLRVIPPTEMTFDECKQSILSKLRRNAIENREQEWVAELRNQIDFVVFDNILAKSFTNFTNQQYVAYE